MSYANYKLPNDTLRDVVRLTGAKSKREAIIIALDAYLKQQKREQLIQSYGKIPLKWTKQTLKKYRG